jgi:hypothetical protein
MLQNCIWLILTSHKQNYNGLKSKLKKGKNRIEALQQNEFNLSSKVSSSLPSVEELKAIKNYIFRIDADTLELRDAVQIQLDKLSVLFLEYNFSATYGGM